MKSRGRQKNNHSKDPNEPVKPPKPYIRYSRSVWERVSAENPGMNIGQIGNAIGRLWRNLPDDAKEVFNQEYKEDLAKYENEIRMYYKSATYLDWVKKNEENNQIKANESPKKQLAQLEKMVMGKDIVSENSYLQPEFDSDEEVSFMDVKMESSNRFYRNHSLMLELFSDTRVTTTDAANSSDEQQDVATEIQLKEVQSYITLISNNHLNRLMEIKQKNDNFHLLMQLENEKLQSLIDARQRCD